MVFPGGSFAVVSPANLGFTEEVTTAIVAQVAGQINAKFEDFWGADGQQLLNTLPAILDQIKLQKTQIAAMIGEQAALTEQLNSRMPEI